MKLGIPLFAKSSAKNKALNAAPAIALAVLTLIAYLPSLSVGFLSDDFSQYAYFYQHIQGDFWSLLSNINGAWMKDIIQDLHWRPMMLAPHLFDCFLWHFNAAGYHLTNILLHCICVVSTYFIAKQLQNEFRLAPTQLLPLAAATTFALFPSLTEAVSWISGRVDPCYAATYLLSFLCFLHAERMHSKRLYAVSILFAAATLLTKENAITLPFLITWFLLCKNFTQQNIVQLVGKAIYQARMYWLTAFAYLALRTLALGTFVGGYLRNSDSESANAWLTNLLNPLAISQLFVPVANYAANEELLKSVCLGLAISAVITGFCKLVLNNFSKNLLRIQVFACGWAILSFAIVAKVWSFASVVSGGRHTYLVSAALCLWFASALFAEENEAQTDYLFQNRFKKNTWRILRAASVFIATAYAGVFFVLCNQHQALWQKAGLQTTIFRQALIDAASSKPESQRIALLNPPVTCGDIDTFCRFNALRDSFRLPFQEGDLYSKIETPRLYLSPSDLLRKSALDETLSMSPSIMPLIWDPEKSQFYDCARKLKNLSESEDAPKQAALLPINITPYGFQYFALSPINAVSLSKNGLDAIEITADYDATANDTKQAGKAYIEVAWNDDTKLPHDSSKLLATNDTDGIQRYYSLTASMAPATGVRKNLIADRETHTYLFHLSEFSTWLLKKNPSVNQIRVVTHSQSGNIRISNVRLINLESEIPKLSANTNKFRRNFDGTLSHSYHNCPLQFSYDARSIAGTKSVILTVSAPNQLSEPSRTSYRQTKPPKETSVRVQSTTLNGEMSLNAAQLPISANYEITVAALNSNGDMIGYRSEPLILRFEKNSSQFTKDAAHP